MITEHDKALLANALIDAVEAGSLAIHRWGNAAQFGLAIEEAGEYVAELGRLNRPGRCDTSKVIDEAADVIITALQVGQMLGRAEYGYSLDDLTAAINAKVARLRKRIEEERP